MRAHTQQRRHPPAEQTKPTSTCQTGSFDQRNGWGGGVEETQREVREEGEKDDL